MGRLTKTALIGNVCLWVYFWFAFAYAAQPYDPRPWGHLPVDPYSFGNHAIGLTRSSLTYPFMKVAFGIEFPSFLSVALFRKIFLSTVSGDTFFAGVSVGGYALLVTMLLSFLQWYVTGRVVQKLWHKTVWRPDYSPRHEPSV